MENSGRLAQYSISPDALALLPDDDHEAVEILEAVWEQINVSRRESCYFTLQVCGKLRLSETAPGIADRWLVMDSHKNVSLVE